MLKEGDAAPDFVSKDAEGNEIKLSDFRGQKVVLFFYPKDDTPG
jgi:peroxiredoxin Q/BCP